MGASDGLRMNFQMEGVEEIAEHLGELSKKKMKAILRNAVTYAATPLRQAAARNAPVDTRALKQYIIKRVQTYSQSGNSVAIVGAAYRAMGEYRTNKRGRIVLRKPAKYAHLVEGGHRIAKGGKLDRKRKLKSGGFSITKGTGKHAGNVKPHPFLAPAFMAEQATVFNRLQEKISDGLEKEATRISSKGAP